MRGYDLAFLLFVALHLLCSLLVLLGIRTGFLKLRVILFPVMLLLPVCGEVLVLLLHHQVLARKVDTTAVGVEKFVVESELYKGIVQEVGSSGSAAVSMEEALLVNAPKERRSLVLSILNDNSRSYVDLLKLAGSNDDTEVVHYAVTAMVQITKENDALLWEYDARYAENPEDPELLSEYCEFLWICLKQGLMPRQTEQGYRGTFDTLIRKKIQASAPNVTDYLRCIENEMERKNHAAARAMLHTAQQRWPYDSELLLAQARLLVETGDGAGIQSLVEDMEKNGGYLSAKAKEAIAFWRK